MVCMQEFKVFATNSVLFKDRREAGKQLAQLLENYRKENTVVLGLPRGGVPVAFEVAQELEVPLDVIVSRKIGAPGNPEFGIGAISENDTQILDKSTAHLLGISENELEEVISKEKQELSRRIEKYRGGYPLPFLENKTVILVDDGLATGVTARAAIAAIKRTDSAEIVFAAPVCAYDTTQTLATQVANLVCFYAPYDFRAAGMYYQEFEQTSDEEVVQYLRKAKRVT
jgi:putative phosphoribosyl transferase